MSNTQDFKIADLSYQELQKIENLEKELGFTLIAYGKEKGTKKQND